jgi:hypothetical protein
MLKVIIPIWGSLGFYRGVKLYNYDNKKALLDYENNKDKEFYKVVKPQYFYSSCVGNGSMGFFFYVNPFMLFLTIPKELYRLEVNMRSLNDEKEKDKYYKLL